ncbi:hypothetical protein SAMN05216251_11974 [Actinacidiphila alni]|uniref:Uncharacterized protein n=1 Tax=Actinacidiphila alni TaxID=380248 RepID=A0A1I2JRG6_9ACTN|nr:hypothetical protein [Actinacidiphila alni]SFF56748.1 hypothetical protein SAMN05216251_11974 [Actinacidiphila alni]
MTTSQVTRPPAGSQPPVVAVAVRQPETIRAPRRGLRRGKAGPRRLGTRAVTALVLLAALCAVAVVGAVSVRSDTADLRDAVNQRAAVAAQLRFALADLDAQRADTLAPGRSATDDQVEVGNQLVALITAQQRRAEVSEALRQLGADRGNSGTVGDLLNSLGRYDDLSGRAAYVDEQQPDRTAGHPPTRAVAMNVQAGQIMQNELLPKATHLAAVYQNEAADLESTAHDAAMRWTLVIGVIGALALVFLLWWQWEMAVDYRRLFNPALVVTTAAVLAVTLAGTVALTSSADAVATANREGLRPWSRLAEARAVAAQAAASESRWFVHDAAYGVADKAQFDGYVKQLDALLRPNGYATAAERPGYDDVLTRYGHFRADDTRLRSLKSQGRTDEAAVVLTNVGRGDVAFDFWDFATTLDALAGLQLADFDSSAKEAHDDLAGWPLVPAGALGVAGLLVLLGVRSRFAEYR